MGNGCSCVGHDKSYCNNMHNIFPAHVRKIKTKKTYFLIRSDYKLNYVLIYLKSK